MPDYRNLPFPKDVLASVGLLDAVEGFPKPVEVLHNLGVPDPSKILLDIKGKLPSLPRAPSLPSLPWR